MPIIPKPFISFRRFTANGHRAPHKPLLILYALAQWQMGKRVILFAEAEERLNQLIRDFGGIGYPRSSYPFVRLANDGVWEIKDRHAVVLPSLTDYSPKQLKEWGVTGSFTAEIAVWMESAENREALIQFIIQENFPETYYLDIVEALNLTDPSGSVYIQVRQRRDPEFRERILDAYERSCALCNYQIRKGDQLVGLEAAHIQWHAAGGPDTENNGLALCAVHHKLFDYGLFSVNEQFQVLISPKANGSGTENWLHPYRDTIIRLPKMSSHLPLASHTTWHRKEVFVGERGS